MLRISLCTIGLIASLTAVVGASGTDTSAGNTVLSSPSAASRAAVDMDPSLFDVTDEFHGVTRPSESADLPSLVPGMISAVFIQEGQFVKKGSPLITLDDRIPRARLAAATVEANLNGALRRAEVDLRLAQSRLDRMQRVVGSGAGARFELEEAEGVRDQAQAAVEQQRDILKAAEANRQLAEAQLAQYTITAPFDGMITEIHQKSGAIDPTKPLVSLANLNVLEVEMHLPSRLFGSVRGGQSVRLEASAPISSLIACDVVSVSPIINSASDTFRCLLRFDNSATQLPAGFSVVLQENGDNGHGVANRQP